MDLDKLSKKELQVLEAVFVSFDQGDVGCDLADADGDVYEQMRDQILNREFAEISKQQASAFPIKVRFPDGTESSFKSPQDLPPGKAFVVVATNC